MIEVERGPGGSGRDVMIPLTGIHIFESCTVGLFGNGQGREGQGEGKGDVACSNSVGSDRVSGDGDIHYAVSGYFFCCFDLSDPLSV
jgi:hypothetical protein